MDWVIYKYVIQDKKNYCEIWEFQNTNSIFK